MKKELSRKIPLIDELQSLFNTYEERIKLLEERQEKLEKRISGDEPIKEFPENTTNEQKEILNGIAKELLIKPQLTQNSKYQLAKERDLKDVIRKLYKIVPNYTHKKAYAFLIMFIETNKEGSVVSNYCREIKKDIPTKETNCTKEK